MSTKKMFEGVVKMQMFEKEIRRAARRWGQATDKGEKKKAARWLRKHKIAMGKLSHFINKTYKTN